MVAGIDGESGPGEEAAEDVGTVREALESVAPERGGSVEGKVGEAREAVFHVGPLANDRQSAVQTS